MLHSWIILYWEKKGFNINSKVAIIYLLANCSLISLLLLESFLAFNLWGYRAIAAKNCMGVLVLFTLY